MQRKIDSFLVIIIKEKSLNQQSNITPKMEIEEKIKPRVKRYQNILYMYEYVIMNNKYS